MLEKTFDPASAEPRLYAAWEASGAFAPIDDPAAPTFTMVIPPPNVTGSLHIGHALNNTLQDVLARFARMRGMATLWVPGTDHAGIATQMVVERQLAAQGNIRRVDMGRDEFVDRVWQWKAESGGTISNQLRRLGASCDWTRERFTLDDGLSRAVREVFVSLHRQGLIYRDKRLVNWDPHFQTAISDLEVETRDVKGKMWHFAYPLEGESDRRRERDRHRHHPAGNHAGRWRRGRPPGRCALHEVRRPHGPPAHCRSPDPHHRRPISGSRRKVPARSRSPAPTTSTTSRSPCATA